MLRGGYLPDFNIFMGWLARLEACPNNGRNIPQVRKTGPSPAGLFYTLGANNPTSSAGNDPGHGFSAFMRIGISLCWQETASHFWGRLPVQM